MLDFFGFEVLWLLFVIGIIGGIVYLVRRDKSEDKKLDALFWKKFALGSAVALVFPFMVYYGIQTFTERPAYSDYVTVERLYRSCSRDCSEEQKMAYETNREKHQAQVAEWDEAVESHAVVEFVVWLVFGMAAIAGGMFLKIPAVSTGFMWGGTFSVLTGYLEYVVYMSDAMMFISAVLALAGFVIIAYKKFGKSLEG